LKLLGIKNGEHLLWCFAAGLIAACVYGFFAKCVIGKLIRGLAREDASDEQSAIFLKSIGCGGFIFKLVLSKGSTLSDSVIATEDGRYYLLPENKDKMLSKYGANSGSLISLVLTLLVALVVAILCAALLPWITDLYKGLAG